MRKVAFKTLGCKVNTYESESMWQIFKKNNYSKVDIKEVADVYVINTCTVTNTADRKSRQAIRQAIRKNPDAVVVVSGCYTQLASEETKLIDGVDIILGTQNRDRVVEYVELYLKDKTQITSVDNIMEQKEFEKLNIVSFESQTRAFLKIQEGCNNFCSFCVIPWARGLMRSQKPERIIAQIEDLVENGVNEIVLTGIHTGGYGQDFDKYSFADLLEDIANISGLKRVRISSIEISQLDDSVIDILANNEMFAKHLHIPIQSANDEILEKMKRKYTVQEFINKITEIRKRLGNIAITTDLIVGFPGETDEHFTDAINTLDKIKFSDIHVFPYSKRSGTPAAKMESQVPELVKKQRVNKVIELNDKNKREYIQNFIDTEQLVVVERLNKDNFYEGYTSNYIKVEFKSEENLLNKCVSVKVVKQEDDRNICEKIS